jgi:putative glutamine amidotransferase
MESSTQPVIGITVDNRDNSASSGTYECAIAYVAAVVKAGGVPVLLPHEVELVPRYLEICDGFLITGGADVRLDVLRGEAMHPMTRPMDERRQAFEFALLKALDPLPDRPVLAICLGMQLMTLHAGGQMNQHLDDTLPDAQRHRKNNRHGIDMLVREPKLGGAAAASATVVSSHHQGMTTAGRLRTLAHSDDGLIEAVDDPARRFYLGVQWHPERGGEGELNQALIDRLVSSCRRAT